MGIDVLIASYLILKKLLLETGNSNKEDRSLTYDLDEVADAERPQRDIISHCRQKLELIQSEEEIDRR